MGGRAIGSGDDGRHRPGVISLLQTALRRRVVGLSVAVTILVAACGASTPTPGTTLPPSATPGAAASPSPASSATSSAVPTPTPLATATTTPSASTIGFAFAADDVVAYYESQGYACTAAKPSTKAAGFHFRSCRKVDSAGRTLVIGVVTDPAGNLADGFASVQAADASSFLEPTDALDPLAGFMGAMLGEDQGAAILMWLAGHLGDVYAETTIGGLTIATYAESDTDRSRLYVELANESYIAAPGVQTP